MPIFNFLKKQFKKIIILLFLSFIVFHWAKAYFPENKIAQKYVEQYENFLNFSENILEEVIPGLDWYFSSESDHKKAYDVLIEWDDELLDKVWATFQMMEKYVNVQKAILILKNPSLVEEFKTAWVSGVLKSIDAMKNYKKMQEEVFQDAWIDNGESFMTFEEIIEYSKIIESINNWTKIEKDLISFLDSIPDRWNNELKNLTSNLKNQLIKVWADWDKQLENGIKNAVNVDFNPDEISTEDWENIDKKFSETLNNFFK